MMDEPDAPQVSDISMADTSDTVVTDVPRETAERFERGEDMPGLYEQMRPDQRTAVAGEFIRLLTLAGDDQADQFRDDFRRHTQITDTSATGLLSADQVVSIDRYVREKHPEMIGQVLRHPVTQSALEIPGAEPQAPETEEEAAANEDKIMPTENVATSGAAYATSGDMMELGGEKANRLAEEPHEFGAGPGGELEREQRYMENRGEEAERPTEEQPGSNL